MASKQEPRSGPLPTPASTKHPLPTLDMLISQEFWPSLRKAAVLGGLRMSKHGSQEKLFPIPYLTVSVISLLPLVPILQKMKQTEVSDLLNVLTEVTSKVTH